LALCRSPYRTAGKKNCKRKETQCQAGTEGWGAGKDGRTEKGRGGVDRKTDTTNRPRPKNPEETPRSKNKRSQTARGEKKKDEWGINRDNRHFHRGRRTIEGKEKRNELGKTTQKKFERTSRRAKKKKTRENKVPDAFKGN